MSIDTINTIKKQENQMDKLQALLEEQVEMVKNGNFRGVETLIEQSNSVVAEMAKTPLPPKSQWKGQGEYLTKLYKKLELMIEAEKDSTSKKLRKVGNGKKTIRTYHH